MKAQLLQRIQDRSVVVGVVGLGYVGLPLAVAFGQAGVRVLGVDVDANKVARLSRGESYVPDVSDSQVAELVRRGSLSATTDYAVLHAADAVILCVPTPLRKTRDPDLSYIVNASESLMPHVRPGQLVVLESTTYPGTTEEVLEPQLRARGFRIGEDVFLAFSPERIDPGNRTFTVRNTPKVVGGATAACTEVAAALYGLAVERVVTVSSTRAAEMVKLLENTFRAVNIGLVNEVALMCARLGVDVWEVIDAAATKPYGFMKFTPGPGIGGHCLSGQEFVFIKDENGCRAIRLKDLVDELEAQPTRRLSTTDTLILAPKGLSTLSFDAQSRQTCFKPLQYVSRRAFRGRMLEVLTQDGRRLTVTDGHPMLIWRDGELVTRRAEALQPGDELPVPLGTSETPAGEIDLIAHLSESDIARARLENYARERSKRMPIRQHIHYDGFVTVKVRSITETAPVDVVYSLEVADTHTFVTSYGLLVHNCIPVDPLYLSWKLKALNYTARFIELADAINGQMPQHVVTLAAEALNEAGKPLYHANVLVLGAAYKPDVDDVRESPALDVMIELQRRHARVSYHDPHVPTLTLGAETLASTPLTADSLQAADCVIIITAHTTIDWALVAEHAQLVIDTRNALRGRAAKARVIKL